MLNASAAATSALVEVFVPRVRRSFQRAGVDAAECADSTHIAPVLVFLRQRRDEFGCGQLELVCLRQRIGGDGLGLDVD